MTMKICYFPVARSVAMTALALFLGACSGTTPTLDTGPDAEATFDGLYEIKGGSADKAWARPDLDLSGYNKIMLQGVGIEYRPGGETRRRYTMSTSGPWALTDDQKARLQKAVTETAVKELGESSRFTLVDKPGPDVLLIRVGLLDVVSYVPPEPISRGEIFLSEIGAATLVLEIRDSQTGAILVRAADRSTIGKGMGMTRSNRATNTFEVKAVVRSWMSALRDRLDGFSGFNNEAG